MHLVEQIIGHGIEAEYQEAPMPSTEELPRLLSIEQLAEHLGVTDRHVRRLVAERRVPFLKWRRFIRFDPEEIAAWLDAARQPQQASPRQTVRGRSS
jgi:excisionase family DNA binding protein